MILSLLKGIGDLIMHFKEVVSLLSSLMMRRRQYYNELDKCCQKMSNTEIQIMCLLLEVCLLCCACFSWWNLQSDVWFESSFLLFCRGVLCRLPPVGMISKTIYWRLCRWETKMHAFLMPCHVIWIYWLLALGHFLFQLDAMLSDDHAYVEPCITVLSKLNNQFYTGLKNEVQVLLAIYIILYRVCCCHSW